MIKRKGSRFYVEVFHPRHEWRLLGVVITINIPDEQDAFVTHFKQPDRHFFVKGRGYPINVELLNALRNARIDYVIIPEDGKRGFKAWLGKTDDYLRGGLVREPRTEAQFVIPLKELTAVDIDRERLWKYMYG